MSFGLRHRQCVVPRRTPGHRSLALALLAAVIAAPASAIAQSSAAGPTPDDTLAPENRMAVPRPSYAGARDATEILVDSIDLIQREYVDDDVTREELVEAALRGIVEHLNRRAVRAGNPGVNALLSRREMGRLTDSLSGEATGIGILGRPLSSGGIEVLRVFSEAPAGKAGIRPGDRIAAIDDRPVIGLEGFSLLRGEQGAPVRLSVVRESTNGVDSSEQRLEVKVIRSRYRVAAVEANELDGGIGYLKVMTLTRAASEDVAGALLDFQQVGCWGAILDLRGNPGGSLHEARKIAEMFVPAGQPLLTLQTNSGESAVLANGEVLWTGPLIVIINRGTASASEALAAALKANNRLLLGEPTAGRGLGESIFPLPTGGALRLATARYKTPGGESWLGKGVQPNVYVGSEAVLDPTEPFDAQLRNAIMILQSLRPAERLSPLP